MPEEGALRVVREFVNTYDVEKDVEALAGPADLIDWLRHAELLDGPAEASEADLRRARALREGIRGLLIANHDGTRAPAAAAVVDEAARRARLRPRFEAGGVRFEAQGPPVERALGALLAVIAAAMLAGTATDGSWRRLKVCSDDTCRWAFYDASRSGAGRWCSMAICGNRRKARAYRQRRADADAGRLG